MRSIGTVMVALLLLPSLAACQDNNSGEPAVSASRPPDSSAPPPTSRSLYSATLEQPEASASAPASDGPLDLVLTNTGRKPDRYLVRLIPPGAGAVMPERVELEPGDSQPLRVLAPSAGGDATVTVISLGREDVVASLTLPTRG